jgi:hypothetical protein
MANIYVEGQGPQGPQIKISLPPTAVSGYMRGLCVNFGASNLICALAAQAATAPLGILEEDAVSTKNPCSVILFGEAIAQIGASVSAGQNLTTDANGRLVPAVNGQPIVAVALEAQSYVAANSSGVTSCALVFFFGALGAQQAAVSDAITHLTASGAITVANGTVGLGSAAPLAMTLATPSAAQDGVTITITAETSQAHTVTTAGNKINGNSCVIAFAAQGDSVTLEATGQIWNVRSLTGSASVLPTTTIEAASGAIAVSSALVNLNGAAALTMTLANPSVAQERTRLAIVATTTHAHTVTTAATKINGADDTVTYAAVGDGIVLEARNQGWIVIASIGGATLSEV